jgi:hypothetical protein
MSDEAGFRRAYQAVGEYFCAFSALDRALGQAVKVVLDLDTHPARDFVVAALESPVAKASLVLAAVAVAKNKNGSEPSTEWKERAKRTVKKAFDHNENTRVPMAHAYLEPQADGSVKVTRLNVRGGRFRGNPKSWNVEDKITEARKITKDLQRITADLRTLTISIPDLDWLVPLSEPVTWLAAPKRT